MLDNERLQFAGPVCLVAAISCAELSAQALASWPTSSFAWFLNLEVFRSFQYSLNGFGTARWQHVDGLAASIWIAVPLLALLLIGMVCRLRLPIALAAHFSALYGACLVYGGYVANQTAIGHLTLTGLWTPSSALDVTILLVSLLSSTVSHRFYWREIIA